MLTVRFDLLFPPSLFSFTISFSFSSPLPPANSFPDRMVMFVLQKLENSNERSRMGSLAVLRHLINSTSEKSCTHSSALLILTLHTLFGIRRKVKMNYPFSQGHILKCYVCFAASTMESKKLLILASIRHPMADHSNKVTHTYTHTEYLDFSCGPSVFR